eukprot:547093-Prymnesium_polylepis.3
MMPTSKQPRATRNSAESENSNGFAAMTRASVCLPGGAGMSRASVSSASLPSSSTAMKMKIDTPTPKRAHPRSTSPNDWWKKTVPVTNRTPANRLRWACGAGSRRWRRKCVPTGRRACSVAFRSAQWWHSAPWPTGSCPSDPSAQGRHRPRSAVPDRVVPFPPVLALRALPGASFGRHL